MTKFTFLLACVVLTVHFSQGGHVQDTTKKLKKCPLDRSKKYSNHFQCIDLKPPSDVETALQTCWQEAIEVEFVCIKRENIFTMMRNKYKSKHGRDHKKRGHSEEGKTKKGKTEEGESATTSPQETEDGKTKTGRHHHKRHHHRRHHWRRRMMKMIIFKHLILKNLHWWIFFTKEVAPPVFPALVPEVRRKIQDRFRTCFLKKTKIGFEDKVNGNDLIGKLRLYKGHESNTTLMVNLIQKCSANATYQSEFASCMTRNIAVTCIKKYVEYNKQKWSKYKKHQTEEAESKDSEKEEDTEDDEEEKKAEDKENEDIQNQIVNNYVSTDENSKDIHAGGKSSYGKGKYSSKRKGRSTNDDDEDDDDDKNDDDDDDDDKEDKSRNDSKTKEGTKEERIKAWREKMKGKKGHGSQHHWSHKKWCEPCFDLKSSEELKSVFKTCYESSSKGTYYSKVKECVKKTKTDSEIEREKERSAKWAKYMSKYLDSAWLSLFKPWSTHKSIFHGHGKDEKLNCILGKLGLGTTNAVYQNGFNMLIKAHLVGDDKSKEVLTETVNKCAAAPRGKISHTKFAECSLTAMETSCGTKTQ